MDNDAIKEALNEYKESERTPSDMRILAYKLRAAGAEEDAKWFLDHADALERARGINKGE